MVNKERKKITQHLIRLVNMSSRAHQIGETDQRSFQVIIIYVVNSLLCNPSYIIVLDQSQMVLRGELTDIIIIF